MGNEQTHSSIQINEKTTHMGDFYTHHNATIHNKNLTVLIGDLYVEGSLWTQLTPLEKNTKLLKIYRHPSILKYVSSWTKNSKYFLAIEEAVPLSLVLKTQTNLQISIGLYSILKALCFLHENAQISHNNVNIGAIYVSKDGSWKLGGMEYACKYADLNLDYLKKSNNTRYKNAIHPDEQNLILTSPKKDFIDVYGFSILVSEILDNPTVVKFTDFCNSNPDLCEVLNHDFFTDDFIQIYQFLLELPLKSDDEKVEFFQSLIPRLKQFPELSVASQFGNLLLSRLVLLNKTAQDVVLPFILSPKLDSNLFSDLSFKILAPKLMEIFCVRDAQIRFFLLNYFKNFVHIFTPEELTKCILPELLVGVKDTDDGLVAQTLHVLADLVPILGAQTVIGGQRGKLFTDGRPVVFNRRKNSKKVTTDDNLVVNLPERQQPDGEEVETSEEAEQSALDEDLENWEDWGENNPAIPSTSVTNKPPIPDITDLDIKTQTNSPKEDFDFFQDMEPVISTPPKFLIEDKNCSTKSKLEIEDETNEDGWGEEEW